ncbi:MAG: YihY/virulence factor BrkB family protein [Candidatus Fimivivens sp.]
MFAASSAFYLFLSLVPLVVLFLGLIPFTSLTQGMILQPLLNYAPAQFQQLIHLIVAEVYNSSLSVISLSLITELWSSSRFFACLARSIGEIYEGYQEQGFIRLRLHGILYTVLLILFVVLDVLIVVFGEYLLHLISSYTSYDIGLWETLLNMRGLFFIVYLTFYNAMLFTSLPRGNLKFRQQLPGALFSAVAWFAFSKMYAFCIDVFHFFGIYGSLTIIIISLLWLYYSMYILYLGAYLNAFLHRYKPNWWQKYFGPVREQ